MLNFQINRDTKSYIREAWIKEVAKAINKSLRLKKKYLFSLILVGDSEIRQLNKQYRHKDKVTDVLSFVNDQSDKFVDPKLDKDYVGEVIISVPQARRQARQLDNSFKKEIARLVVHGVVHLFGYDHENVSVREAQKMSRLESTIMSNLKL